MKDNRAKILPEKEDSTTSRPTAAATAQQYEVRGITGLVYEMWTRWAEERISKEKVWLQCEKAYLSKFDVSQGTPKWKSRAFVPASFSAVENIHSQIMSGLFPNERFFDVYPMEDGYDVRAEAAKELLYQQVYASDFRTNVSQFLKQLIIIGNSAAIVDWSDEYSGEDKIFSGSRFKTLDMKYFHVDPFASDPQTANKMRKYWLTYEEAEALDIFDDDALKLLKGAPSNGGISSAQEDANHIATAQAADMTTGVDEKRGGLEITELWGSFEHDGERYDNYVCSVANGVLLRLQPSPYEHGRDPFIFARFSVVAGEAYGIGALEPALPLQYLINSFTNQKVDELSIIINGMYKFKDDGVIDIDNLVSEPGAMFEVADMDNLQGIAPTSAVSLAYQEIGDLERKFEEATGAIKLVAGGAPDGARTATEVMALTQSGNSRFNEILAQVEASVIRPALRMYLSNAAQFMSEEQSIKILGADEDNEEVAAWTSIHPDDIQGRYDIKPGGSRLVAMREFRLKNLMTYLQTVGQVEALAPRLDWSKINKRIMRELGFDGDDDFLKPEQPQAMAAPQPTQPQQAQPQSAAAMNPQLEQMMAGQEGGVPDGATQ